jgi:hypothetical protein
LVAPVVEAEAVSGEHPGPLDYLLLGLSAVGFVTVMGLIAFAFEPYYRVARERLVGGLRRAWRNERAWEHPQDAPLGRLPATWTTEQAARVRGIIKRLRK